MSAAAHEGVDSPRETWSCDDWYAYLNIMPGTRPTLRVGATCTARTTGYRFALARQNTQGINPKDLLLHLVIEVPTPGTTVEDVVTEYHVQYVEHTDMRYDSVSIVPGGPTLEVKIVQ